MCSGPRPARPPCPTRAIRRACLPYLQQLRPLYAHGTEVATRRDWRLFQKMMRLLGPRLTLWLAAHAKKG